MKPLFLAFLTPGLLLLLAGPVTAAEATNVASLPDTGTALFRVLGALMLVFGLLFGGVWLMKNWQRFALRKGRAPRLRLLETQSLGGRQGVFVISYEQQRFLVAASPTGVSLLSHLPDADVNADEVSMAAAPNSFVQALQAVVARPS